MAPFKGPRLAFYVAARLTEIQRHCQVCPTRCRGPRTPSRTIDAKLDCAIVENALFCCSKYWRGQDPLCPPFTTPWYSQPILSLFWANWGQPYVTQIPNSSPLFISSLKDGGEVNIFHNSCLTFFKIWETNLSCAHSRPHKMVVLYYRG